VTDVPRFGDVPPPPRERETDELQEVQQHFGGLSVPDLDRYSLVPEGAVPLEARPDIRSELRPDSLSLLRPPGLPESAGADPESSERAPENTDAAPESSDRVFPADGIRAEANIRANLTCEHYRDGFARDGQQLAEHEARLAAQRGDEPSGAGTAKEELEDTRDLRLTAQLLEHMFGAAATSDQGNPDDGVLIVTNVDAYERALSDAGSRYGGKFWKQVGSHLPRKKPWLMAALITKFRVREVAASGSLGLFGVAQGTISVTFERRSAGAQGYGS
jgi:hypothetical protein